MSRNEPVEISSEDSLSSEEGRHEGAVKFKRKLYQILKSSSSQGATFAVSGEMTGAPFTAIEIEGIGPVVFPVYEQQAKNILEKFAVSPFGKRTETVVDTNVRNSKELNPDAFKILNPAWEKYIKESVLTTVAGEMYIKTPFKASLYKLLLYEPGSFFKPHRDTEKEPGMFGTLVIQLPSKYAGGELHVKHENKTKQFDFSSSTGQGEREFKMFFIAFYCDCQHEILPVTKGYRICLIYNLVSTDNCPAPEAPRLGEAETKFCEAVKDWPEDFPSKIVYVLSHKYSESGLSFANLKGTDRAVAGFLKYCAENCSLRLYLALFSKHVSGAVEGDKYDYTILYPETDYELKNLVSFSGQTNTSASLNVKFGDEVVPSSCFRDLEPDTEEYQEYTGNSGANVEKWYRSAAIVFWPDVKTLNVLKKDAPSMITDIYLDVFNKFSSDPVGSEGSLQILKWLSYVLQESSSFRSCFSSNEQGLQVLKTVVALNKLELLLQYLNKARNLLPASIPLILDQCEKYGWEALGPSITLAFQVNTHLSNAVAKLLLFIPEEDTANETKRSILSDCLETLLSKKSTTSTSMYYWQTAAVDSKVDKDTLYNLFVVSKKLRYDISEYAKSQPILQLSSVVLQLYSVPGIASYSSWINTLQHCDQSLSSIVAENLEAASFSRSVNLGCNCQDCFKLQAFLRSERQVERFKVAKPRRFHLHQKLNFMSDITHETERVGVPQTMVVTKIHASCGKKKEQQEEAAILLPKLKEALSCVTSASIEPPVKVLKVE